MKIWIDMVNVPHVNFFKPIVNSMQGHELQLTTRRRGETYDLARIYGMDVRNFGNDYRNNLKKIISMINRTVQLNFLIKKFDYTISLENAMNILIAKMRSKSSILFLDNEQKFQNTTFFQKQENKIKTYTNHLIIPECTLDSYKKFFKSDIITYDGYKEDIYIADYKPNKDFIDQIPFKEYIVIRPETLGSLYVKHKESLTVQLLKHFSRENFNIIYLPREREDRLDFVSDNIHIPDKPLNGLDLCYFSRGVLTGSGTMAREAAVLERPSVSYFPNKTLLKVDESLREKGKIFHSRDCKEIVEYIIGFKPKDGNFERSRKIKVDVLGHLNSILEK
jgi:hypothetical protein